MSDKQIFNKLEQERNSLKEKMHQCISLAYKVQDTHKEWNKTPGIYQYTMFTQALNELLFELFN